MRRKMKEKGLPFDGRWVAKYPGRDTQVNNIIVAGGSHTFGTMYGKREAEKRLSPKTKSRWYLLLTLLRNLIRSTLDFTEIFEGACQKLLRILDKHRSYESKNLV